jgi:serine/threonine protein kinase
MNDELQPGDVLRERYEIRQVIGSTRHKMIYLAYDHVLECQVVIDVFSSNSALPSGLTLSAWEARVLGYLGDNPNIATILDYWEENETAVMVTRYLPGGSLRDLIARSLESGKNLPAESILRLSAEIATALAYIHHRRILYLDLQPRNVLFDEWGTVHLVDFDAAVSIDDQDMSDLSRRPVNDYMAPELIDDRNVDQRADLYSLGATIYEMCQGCSFTRSRAEILTSHRAGPPPSLKRKDLPEALRELIFSLLAPDREQRPSSANDVVRRLDDIRAARADLANKIKTLTVLLNADLSTIIKLPHGVQSKLAFTKISPEIGLSSDHHCLMLAIIALAETDYRQAVIDAGTAAEIALRAAISHQLGAKGLNSKCTNLIIQRFNGLTGLLALYISFEYPLPVSEGSVKGQLANIRNSAAHAGRIPSLEEASRAVGIARTLVNTIHPFDMRI